MYNRYPHLLEPIRVGSLLLRNRIISAPTGLHALQGGQPYPTETVMATLANKAKGGAAVVTCTGTSPWPVVDDGEHASFDIYRAHSLNYLAQLTDTIHFYGARASMEINGGPKGMGPGFGYDVSAGVDMRGNPVKEMTLEMIEESVASYAFHAKQLVGVGFDMLLIHMGYRSTIGARFLSPISNSRTDKYGGCVENRTRFLIEVTDAIRKACGKNVVLELRFSGFESAPGGITIEDSIEMSKLLEGHIDLLHVHGGGGPDVTNTGSTHIMGFRPKYALLPAAEAIKKGGTKIPVITIGGYQDLDDAERILADGKADLIAIARGIIADPNLVRKAIEGRPEDVVPCIRCMRCHDSGCLERRYLCTVNPTIGLEHKLDAMLPKTTAKKKVAVVGGGPSGMEAALAAADRGHDVTLFEKKGFLGGQLVFADYVDFKSALSKFKKYLIAQVSKKENVKVRLNAEATAELLQAGGFDVVLAAVGAEPLVPPIPGANGKNVLTAPQVFGNEAGLAQKIVVIGGGQVGCETALHLAKSGKDVTLIEMQSALAPDASQTYRTELIFYMDRCERLKYITDARCTGIGDTVTYKDPRGAEHALEAGAVVMAAGMRPNETPAVALMKSGCETVLIGDCAGLGNVSSAMRTAFAAASLV